jgi:molybdopterin-guanine dinucleotide biosynthesis protein
MLTLHAWFHPSINLPKELMFDPRELEFTLPATAKVDDLMEAVEDMFFDTAQKLAEPVELAINVLWNLNNPRKALNPAEELYMHFKNEESFGVHGDLMPAVPDLPQIPEQEKIPIMILTGFLGAGKTTLLNYILREQNEKKIAVIENEFGEVSIDDALLSQDKLATTEKVVVMDNGCMCCTVRGDLEAGLLDILGASRDHGNLDALIIETTGMADPVPIVRTIKRIDVVMSFFRVDAVITVADAKHLLGRLDDTVEAGKTLVLLVLMEIILIT